MKNYVKLFEEFIYELNYGNRLFDDPAALTANPSIKFPEELASEFSLNGEKNTAEELMLIVNLSTWFKDYVNTGKVFLKAEQLRELFPLKKKFPKILDPTQCKTNDGECYRLTTVPFRIVLDVLKKVPRKKLQDAVRSNQDVTVNINTTIVPKSKRDFYSFTSSYKTLEYLFGHAQQGASVYDQVYYKKEMFAIVHVPITSPKLIINPDFANILSAYQEFETLYVDNSIKVTKITVPGFSFRSLLQTNKGENFDYLMQRYPDDATISELAELLKYEM
jgi:hypothetical protein